MADDNTQQCVRDDVNVCQLCGEFENLYMCGACKGAWYCSKSHQREDWKKHKPICKREELRRKSKVCGSDPTTSSADSPKINNGTVGNGEEEHYRKTCGTSSSASSLCLQENISEKVIAPISFVNGKENSTPPVVEVEANNVNGVPTTKVELQKCDNTKDETVNDLNISECGLQGSQFPSKSKRKRAKKKAKSLEKVSASLSNGQQRRYYLDHTTRISLPPGLSRDNTSASTSADMGREDSLPSSDELRDNYLLILQSRFKEVRKYVVKCLTQYGICVVDRFLGDAAATEILKEVKYLKTSGLMDQGQLAHGPSCAAKNMDIRGDEISWIDGSEPELENIHFLVSCMDTIMLQAGRDLENRVINERTKAMAACYPGGGRGYIRHVDNPNGDGRCITSIYYLNRDWDVKNDGGRLRIYPVGSDQVANIEPVCDRLLFMWSDRRNPHEVESTMRERYAITVWYYDAVERAEALKRLKDNSSQGDTTSKELVFHT